MKFDSPHRWPVPFALPGLKAEMVSNLDPGCGSLLTFICDCYWAVGVDPMYLQCIQRFSNKPYSRIQIELCVFAAFHIHSSCFTDLIRSSYKYEFIHKFL